MPARPDRLLRALDALKYEYGPGRGPAKLAALRDAWRTRLRTTAQARALHEVLCHWRAYPDDRELLAEVEHLLAAFGRRPDARRHRAALLNSGIAGTDIVYPFSRLTARWIAERWGDRLSIEWGDLEDEDRLGRALILYALPAEAPGLDEAPLPARPWVERLRAPLSSGAAYLVPAQRRSRRRNGPGTASTRNSACRAAFAAVTRRRAAHWRKPVVVADDGLTSIGNDGSMHTSQSESIAKTHIPSSFDLRKIYLADYPAIITGNGRRKPAVNAEIIKAINQGTLIVNYIGHGNPNVWAHEIVFERGVTIPQLENDKYFFLCAATCDFGNYDAPNFYSGAEDLLFLKNAGAIATLSASRVVFSGDNALLNQVFFDSLFNLPREELNLPISLGFALFRTKINLNQVNDKKFHFLGDPTLRLNMPQYVGSIDSINSQILISDIQIKALSNTKIAGTILKPDGTKWNEYNGEGLLTAFDSERTKLLGWEEDWAADDYVPNGFGGDNSILGT